MKKIVSIVTPCYNGEKFINSFFTSILGQTYKYIELIIVNDGSTDNSERLILSYKSKMEEKGYTLVYLKQKNGGPGSAMNNGIKKITGKYVSWIDIDDIYEPDAITSMVKFLEQNKEYPIVRGKVKYVSYNTKKLMFERGPLDPNNEDLFEDYLFVRGECYVFSGIWLVRVEHFDKCLNKREIYPSRYGQGWQLLLPMLLESKCGFIDAFILNCMVHDDSISHSSNTIKKVIKKNNGYFDILKHVILELPIRDSKKNFYMNKLKRKYRKEFLKTIFFLHLKKLMKRTLSKKFINKIRRLKNE